MLNAWANSPTQCQQIKLQKHEHQILVPDNPTLSNTAVQPDGLPPLKTSKIQQYTLQQEQIRIRILDNLAMHGDQITIACYDDLSKDKSFFQERISFLEAEFERLLKIEDMEPETLVDETYNLIAEMTNTCSSIKETLNTRQTDMQSELKQSILISIQELQKTCLTEEQTQEHLHPVVTTINQRLLRLSLQIRETLNNLECQTTMCSEDFISQTHRVIDSRKSMSARRTYDGFKQYCYVDNDFPRSTRRALGDCNCSHQLMAAKINDWISSAKTTRQSAYDLVQQFLETRSKALEDRKMFERRYHELELQTQNEYDQSIERLKSLGLFDVYCDKMDYVFRDWKRRWEARLKFVRDYSTRLCHANSFYVACIVLLIRLLERSKQRQAGLDLHLINYFDRVVSAIETRFQRDQDHYLSAIRKVDQAFMTIANATDAKLMSQIAQKLIDAMTIAVDTRRSLLSKVTDGNDSLYIHCLNDIALDALHFIVKGICLNPDSINWQQRKLEGLSQIKGSTLLLSDLNNVISEREKDDDEADAEVLPTDPDSIQQKDEQNPQSRKPSAKAQAPPAAAAAKKGAKVVRELNEQGLYMDLPDFQNDINLDEYSKTRCFSFNNDGVLIEELIESMQRLLGDQSDADKKKAPPKKGEEPKQCAAVAQLEQGTDDLEIITDKDRLNVTIKMFKDYRAPLHFLLYDFMQQEGQRMAFNAAVDDFKQKIEEWKIEYMKILTEEQNNQYEEALKNYQTIMKEYEKKLKTVKKGEDPPEAPIEPQKPNNITTLPDDVQDKINKVIIPEYKDWDRSNIYLYLLYELLSYEELKQIPNSELQYGFNERAFLDAKIDDIKLETPKISAKPTKSAKKTDSRGDKKDEPQQNIDQGPELFSDSRFVKHGQGELLRNLMIDIFGAEIKESNQKYDLMSKFYIQQGTVLARKSRIDQGNYRVLLQAHQQQYVQQSVIQVQALCAQRNGITQRNMEALSRIINDIEIRYLHDDARFNRFSQVNINYLFETPAEERIPSAKGKTPAKGAVTVSMNEQAMTQVLQRYRLDDYVSVKYSEKDRCVRQVLLTDLFPQLNPTFRLYPEFYEKYFLSNLKDGFEQPYQMHRQIVYAGNSYEYQVRNRYNRDYFSMIRAGLATLKAELEKMRLQGISWGQEGAQYDFTFADKTVANLCGEYEIKPAISVPDDYTFEARHPCVAIYEAKLGELTMLEEDLRSAYATDIYAFKRIIRQLSEAVRVGNTDAIKNNDQRISIQRETSRLSAFISGRIAAIIDQLPNIKVAIETCENIFAKQRPETDKTVQKALSTSSMTRRPRDEVKELEYKRDINQAEKITEFAIAALKLENLYYLLGYERDIRSIWQRQSTSYIAPKEQYLQRQKAYNLYYSLFLGTIYALEALSEGFECQPLIDMLIRVLDGVKPFGDIKNLKPYQVKNKAYIDQSQIDIGTQIREEVTQLFTKFQGMQLELEKVIEESQCVTEQDWFNFYVHEMGGSLETIIGDARRQIQELLRIRDTVISQACISLCTYFTEYIQEQFAMATTKACMQLNEDKDEFLREFNKRFDRLRPVLANAPDKAAKLVTDVEELYVKQMTSLESNVASGASAMQRLLWFQISFQLIPQLLFCLLPTTSSGTTVSLQLNALLQAASSAIPIIETTQASLEQKDSKPAKGKVQEEVQKPVSYEQPINLTVFSNEFIDCVKGNTDEDSMAGQLYFVMDLINRCVAAKGVILGNYAELPTQPKAPEKGKTELPSYLNAVLSETQLEQVNDLETLPLARPLIGGTEQNVKPPSAKGNKKTTEQTLDSAVMPGTSLYALGQAQIQLLDQTAIDQARQISSQTSFCEKQAAIVSLDKLGANLAVTVAGRSFQFYFQTLPVAVNFMAQVSTTRTIYEKVKQDLVEALQKFTNSK